MPNKKKNNVINFPSAPSKLERQVEAILFAASEPLDVETIEKRVQTNTNIKDTDKVETLKKVFPDLSAYSTNLLDHIMNSGRMDLFDDVAKCFVELYNEKMGNQNVILISASKLSHDILTEIKSKVKSLTSKTVYLTNKVDKNLIGGFILKVGDKQYDASFKQQLKNLEHEFFNISIQ